MNGLVFVAALGHLYTPNAERPDDYRCFILDREFENETFMTASNIVPDRSELVHHVIVFLQPPDGLRTRDGFTNTMLDVYAPGSPPGASRALP